MKKAFFSKPAFGMLFTAALFSLTACGDDDEPKVEDKFTTEYTFSAEFSADLLKTADVKAFILSPEGNLTEEIITKEKNTWILKGPSIPDKSGVMFEFDAKPNIAEGDYIVGYKALTIVKCLNNENIFSFKSEEAEHSFTVPAENIEAVYGTSLVLAGEVSANGVVKITDGSDIDFGLNGGTFRPPLGFSGIW